MLSAGARVLAVADAYSAMMQPRAHRGPLSEAEAVRELQADRAGGRLDPVATDAVLAAAGHRTSPSRAGGPAGLTTRESDVLVLLSQGMPNKGIARELGISPKTVSNHIEHVYSKLGVSNRTGAAMYAMQYGIVGSRPQPT
jgi:DNA-binding NarL/FixJ family response regulator